MALVAVIMHAKVLTPVSDFSLAISTLFVLANASQILVSSVDFCQQMMLCPLVLEAVSVMTLARRNHQLKA